MFQSTHPRGVRHGRTGVPQQLGKRFNPRTRVGCDDQPCAALVPADDVSIHAPAWGATRVPYYG